VARRPIGDQAAQQDADRTGREVAGQRRVGGGERGAVQGGQRRPQKAVDAWNPWQDRR
jgi:hypothetical protein